MQNTCPSTQTQKTAKAARNAAAGMQNNYPNARKGANGVLLKKFEAVMCDMFSSEASSSSRSNDVVCQSALQTLSPRYSKLPQQCMSDVEQEALIDHAREYWDSRGLALSLSSSTSTDNPILNNNNNNNSSSPWPFDTHTHLPKCGCVRGSSDSHSSKAKMTKKTKTGKDKGGVGNVRNNERALRKELQLANMIQCVLALLPDHVRNPTSANGNTTNNSNSGKRKKKFRIVDFAGGTGHLAVPLALLLPHCEVVCVDLKKWSLDLLHHRVDGPFNLLPGKEQEGRNNLQRHGTDSHKLPQQSNTIQISKTLPNLSSYHGSIQTYPDEFDIGVSLHACGEASDWVLRKCLLEKACWVICSCCCGKLRRDAHNPYVYQSTGGNEKEISYPQSEAFATLGHRDDIPATVDVNDNKDSSEMNESNMKQLLTPDMFDELAKAADYSDLGDVRKPKNACRRAAKSLVEWDRVLFAKEHMQLNNHSAGTKNDGKLNKCNVILTRMVPWEASPKNDVVIGWFQASSNPYRKHWTEPQRDFSCDVDFEVALGHLFGNNNTCSGTSSNESSKMMSSNDWSAEEEAEIRSQLVELTLGCNTVLKFPKGMGPRKRKLIHYAAEDMELRHWGEGKKDSEKVVVVALQCK